MHRFGLVAFAVASLLLSAAASKDTLGTFSMQPVAPAYGDVITFSWDLPRRTQGATVGMLCRHDLDGGLSDYMYIAEYPIGKGSITGSVSWQFINETSSATPGRLDYTRTAHCSAGMWEERQSTGKGPYGIVSFINFDVEP